jgi:hypothetical protein
LLPRSQTFAGETFMLVHKFLRACALPSFVIALLSVSGCASSPASRPEQLQAAQAYIDDQLITHGSPLNKRTLEGALLYHADFDVSGAQSLRVPFDLLSLYCSNHGGQWTKRGPPERAAASLADPSSPPTISSRLAEADQSDVFGSFHCDGDTGFDAELQPTALMQTDVSGSYRLQMVVQATEVGLEQNAGGEAPPDGWPPPPPASSPAAPGGPTPPSSPPPSAAGAPSSPSHSEASPLDPPAPRPSPLGEKLLGSPKPFGIDLGADSPEVFASKLRLDLAHGACAKDKPDPKAAAQFQEYCWEHPGGSQALALRARFADVGLGPVIAEIELRYPPAAFGWLEHTMRNDWGAPDNGGDSATLHSWNWMHTLVVLTRADAAADGDSVVRVSHRATLVRAQLPVGTAGREQSGPLRIATPWQLQLGYEPAEQARSKLRAAGFDIAADGCKDGGPHARPILIRTCPLSGGRMNGLRTAAVRIVDIGDGKARLAQLEYSFDKRVLDETVRELRVQYGDPIPVAGGVLEWWTGPVGIEITPAADSFGLRYFHGRLIQYFNNALEKNNASEKAIQRQGL